MAIPPPNSLTDPHLVGLLRWGGVGVIPTDTVYGLVALAANKEAVARLYKLKHRESKPGTIIAATIEDLYVLGIESDQLQRAARLWPGPVSVILAPEEKLSYLHQDVGDCPFRLVGDGPLKELLTLTGPLLTTSANQPGEPVATTIDEAKAYFGDQVDFYVDGGIIEGRQPSTIVRLTSNGVEIIRQGAVKLDKQGNILP